jgi:hypothetical protein
MFEVPLDLKLEHHLELVRSKTLCIRLKVILKEVSDVICCCCYHHDSRAGGYSQSGQANGCQLA